MKALSIRQPFPWAILHAGKRIENRERCSWHRCRGPILLHASKAMTWMEWAEGVRFIAKAGGCRNFPSYANFTSTNQITITDRVNCKLWGDSLRMGGIVGRATIVDCIVPVGLRQGSTERHPLANDPWYVGEYGLVLDEVEPLPFVPCKGALGLWDVPKEVLAALAERGL